MPPSRYVFDNASQQAAPRFAGLESTFDPTSRAHMSALGVGDGWDCWELGAGAGGLAVWLAQQVARPAPCWPLTSTRHGWPARALPISPSSATTSRPTRCRRAATT